MIDEQFAIFLDVVGEVLGKEMEFSIDAHGLFEWLQEIAVYLFYPKFRFTICDVKRAVVFVFLTFHEEKILLSTNSKLFIDVVDDVEDTSF